MKSTLSTVCGLLTLICLTLLQGVGYGATAAGTEEESKPNIVIIFADDLGYGDVSCYGAELIDTPNIDRLASQGMKFTDAHAAASLCSPSRYGLLTGKAPWRLNKKGNGFRLKDGDVTIASVLKTQGYRSAAIGKWHLGYSKDWNKLPITGPLERGFDYHFGVPSNHNDSMRCFIENHDIVGREPGVPFRVVKGQDFPDGLAEPRVEDQVDTTLTSKVVQFIRDSADQPFFVYFAACTPHTHVTPAAEFRGTSKAGTFGDHVQELDSHVGTIMQTLEELNLADNTLFIFTSDNGGNPRDFRGTQGVNLNLASEVGSIREKFKTARIDARKLGHMVNGPWRDGKGHPYEGGHRVPFIARWPGHIEPNTESDYLFSLTDMMATFAEASGATVPDGSGPDSISILPVLTGEEASTPRREAVYLLGDGKDDAVAVCTGRWKLVDRKRSETKELFDLENDPGEQNDVAAEHPEVVKRLADMLIETRNTGTSRVPAVAPQL